LNDVNGLYESNDKVRSKAKTDVDQLIGKSDKKKKKNSVAQVLPPPSTSRNPSPIPLGSKSFEKKPLPDISLLEQRAQTLDLPPQRQKEQQDFKPFLTPHVLTFDDSGSVRNVGNQEQDRDTQRHTNLAHSRESGSLRNFGTHQEQEPRQNDKLEFRSNLTTSRDSLRSSEDSAMSMGSMTRSKVTSRLIAAVEDSDVKYASVSVDSK